MQLDFNPVTLWLIPREAAPGRSYAVHTSATVNGRS
jgi:hypothetical protein